MAIKCTGTHFPPDIMLRGIRWSVASPLSTRHVEARREERGREVDHSPMNRGASPLAPNATRRVIGVSLWGG